MMQEATEADTPEKAYARVAATYDEGYRAARWDVYDHVTRETVRPWLPPPGARVLDAGAGTGKWAREFLARGDLVTLLDPSAEMLEVAKRKLGDLGLAAGATFLVGGIERMDLPDASFDFVFCEGDPLSYVRDRVAAAREIVRVLRPGGAFYVSCDSRWYATLMAMAAGDQARLAATFDEGRSTDPYGVPVHAFHPEELAALFRDAGAEDVRVLGKVSLLNFFHDKAVESILGDTVFRKRVMDVEARLAADPSTAGLGGHLQAVGRKPRRPVA